MKNFEVQFRAQRRLGYLPFLTRLILRSHFPKKQALAQIAVEAFTNAVRHADAGGMDFPVFFSLKIGSRKASVRIVDRGKGIAKKHLSSKPSLRAVRGRGLFLIRQLSDRFDSRADRKGHTLEAHVTA